MFTWQQTSIYPDPSRVVTIYTRGGDVFSGTVVQVLDDCVVLEMRDLWVTIGLAGIEAVSCAKRK